MSSALLALSLSVSGFTTGPLGSPLLLKATPLTSRRVASDVVLADPTRNQRLREEVEDPFAKARLFVWPALFAGAGISSFFAITTLLAEAAGAR